MTHTDILIDVSAVTGILANSISLWRIHHRLKWHEKAHSEDNGVRQDAGEETTQ